MSKENYWAFISYRHADNSEADRLWATWLHQEIERYEVPAELVGTKSKHGFEIPSRIEPVFRDEESLAADADLSESILNALDRSKFLVALCSPKAVQSKYVAQEIEHFKTIDSTRIVTAMISGEPGHPENECFPAAIKSIVAPDGVVREAIAADFRLPDGSEGYTSSEAYKKRLLNQKVKEAKKLAENYDERLQLMKLKVIAGILGVPLDTLRQRDKAYRLAQAKKRQRIQSIILLTVTALAIFALISWAIAVKQTRLAEKRTQESEQRLFLVRQAQEKTVGVFSSIWNKLNPQNASDSAQSVIEGEVKAHYLSPSFGDTNADRLHMDSISRNNLGKFYRGVANPAESEKYFLESLELRKQILQDAQNNSQFNLALAYHDVALNYDLLGYLSREQSETVRARGYFQSGLEYSLKAAEEKGAPRYFLHDVAVSYYNLAKTWEDEDMDLSLSLISQAEDYCSTLVTEYPESKEFAYHLASILFFGGKMNTNLLNDEVALAQFDRAHLLLQPFNPNQPPNSSELTKEIRTFVAENF